MEDQFTLEVVADSSGQFIGNGMTFTSLHEARVYARDLMARWVLVTDYRVLQGGDVVAHYGDTATLGRS